MILLTGATGMTGQFVATELLKRGYGVQALVRAESTTKAPSGVEILVGDLSDVNSLSCVAKSVQGIIHTACTFTNSKVDIAAMETLVNSWQTGPFIFISSLDVYGFPKHIPVMENYPLVDSADAYPQGELSGYAYGKVCCERLLIEKAKETNRRDYAILRAPHIWGPHPKAYHRLVHKKLKAGEPIILPGETEQEWSQYGDAWIDVRDLARATVDCLENSPGQAMNALSGHFSWHELFIHLIQLTNSQSKIIHKPQPEITDEPFGSAFYAQPWRFSNERLAQHLTYKPYFSLKQTLQSSLD
ncbi:MAG: NAD-dependent epimerase/dehydratase family protein [Cyanobacteria bacterium J06635_15]